MYPVNSSLRQRVVDGLCQTRWQLKGFHLRCLRYLPHIRLHDKVSNTDVLERAAPHGARAPANRNTLRKTACGRVLAALADRCCATKTSEGVTYVLLKSTQAPGRTSPNTETPGGKVSKGGGGGRGERGK